MSTPTDLRTRKRLAMRQGISTAATRLFADRGFDNVTVDEIAAAADVGRMTVFNHFPRKEDMFFDRDEEGRALLREALRRRETGVSPVVALQRLAHRLVAEGSPYVEFSRYSQAFMATIAASVSLQARARAIRDEIAQDVRLALAEGAGLAPDDAGAHLASQLLLATWSVALVQAHQAFARARDAQAAARLFLALVDKGTLGVAAALAGTPYA